VTFDILRGDEIRLVYFTDFVDGDDVGMIECRGRFCFEDKTTHAIGIGGKLSRKNFERNLATENCILGQVHLTHCASAQVGADIVPSEFCTGSNRHFWGRGWECESVPKLQMNKAPHSTRIS